jgi:hyperosmotically inducible periplasmic protein
MYAPAPKLVPALTHHAHRYSTFEEMRMNKAKLIGACVVAGLMLSTTAFSQEKRAAAREFVKDSAITTQIKAEMAKEKPSTLVKVSVDTEKSGNVVLSGTANTSADKARAEKIARGVKGVATVENNIEVKTN